ncbi:hypothetical protein BJ170DRAFT_40955 [Xylariales sp. AK1849]|nr:hypothetical protein BJ170DRAFT_40955 [Xylariales sp. AK1849]
MSTNGTSASLGPDRTGTNGVDGDNVRQAQDSGNPQLNGADEKSNPPDRHGSVGIKGKFDHQKERMKTKAKPAGGFDSTPIPDAPPGYTVKFVFHRAANLPIADISSGASDPFIEATLSTALPKRHKEDPDLLRRTSTIRRTTEPEWEEEWIVANVPSSGFRLKCRLYDEDWPDHNDRLGNVTIHVPHVGEDWEGFSHKEFDVKKRVGSKRAYLLKAATSAFHKDASMTPRLYLSAAVLGRSDSPPNGQVYTLGPTSYFRHFSPMIGRLAGIQVNKTNNQGSTGQEAGPASGHPDQGHEKQTQQYDFQATEVQLQGPVPAKLYHRFVEFRPLIGMMFTSSGLRGRVLHKALTHQHHRIYNFDSSTKYGQFKPCSEEASLQFLKLTHFDQGGRIFTYVITLDGLFRFTETGKEFGIDLLSKHTMHSNVATYIACSGEFFIRRLERPTGSEDPEPDEPTHPDAPVPGGPPNDSPPTKPQYYQLIIDNDSGTYRPDKSVLPDLRTFLEKNFPGLGIVTLACDDDEDQKLKDAQRKAKKEEGTNIHMVLNRSPSASSFSSDDISDLEETEQAGDAGRRSKKERFVDMLMEEDQSLTKGVKNEMHSSRKGKSSGSNGHP